MKRVITALITPFTAAGELDFSSLDKLLALQAEASNGILLFGSTGEGLALTPAEKKSVLQHVFAAKLTLPVTVAVGGFQLQEQVDWIQYCQDHYPIDSFLPVTPLYAKPGVQGQIAWFTHLLNAAKHPCIPYNIPGRTGVKLDFAAMEALAQHPNLGGLKDSSGNLSEFAHYQQLISPVPIFSGDDPLLPEQIKLGAFGVISVAANVWPQETKAYVDLCLAQKNTPEQDALWIAASNALFLASNPIPLKVLLYRESIIASPTLRLPLTHLDLAAEQEQPLLQLSHKIRQIIGRFS